MFIMLTHHEDIELIEKLLLTAEINQVYVHLFCKINMFLLQRIVFLNIYGMQSNMSVVIPTIIGNSHAVIGLAWNKNLVWL